MPPLRLHLCFSYYCLSWGNVPKDMQACECTVVVSLPSIFGSPALVHRPLTQPKPVSVMVLAVHGVLGERGC